MFEQQNKEKGMELVGFDTIGGNKQPGRPSGSKTTAAGLKLKKKNKKFKLLWFMLHFF